jgi:hypothetical protein
VINISLDLIFLKEKRELASALHDSVDILRHLSEIRKTQADIWGFWKIFEICGYANYDENELLSHMNSFCFEAYRRSGRSSQKEFEKFLGVGPFGEKNLRNTFRTGCRILLMLMYKAECVLLPYKFSRPKGSWMDDPENGVNCYTPLMRSVQLQNIYNSPNSKVRDSHNFAERRAKRLTDMSTKVLFSSSWFSPTDITLEDCVAWLHARKTMLSPNGRFEISPIPFAQLFAHINTVFPGQLSQDITEAEVIFKAGRGARRQRITDRDFVDRIFNPILSANGVLQALKENRTKCHMTLFGPTEIQSLHLGDLLRKNNIHCSNHMNLWLELEADFLERQGYEAVNAWNSMFGRFNFYLFMYLSPWFRDNPDTPFVYPTTPNKFEGRLFYKALTEATSERPLTFLEFSKFQGFSVAKPVTSKLKAFFEWIIVAANNRFGCDGVVQPVFFQEKTLKKKRSVKNIYEDDLLRLNSDFLLSLMSLTQHINQDINLYVCAVEAARYNKDSLNLSEMGYVPFVYVDKCAIPIAEIDCRCLLFLSVNGRNYFNPASFIFPFVLSQGGMRGQNLQWLDCKTYDHFARRNVDEIYGVDILYINTDKIYEQPYTVICRNIVITALDAQNAWRKQMVEEGVSAFDQSVFYEGRSSSKWGEVNCLFSHDPDTGNPISDSQYERIHTFLAFSYQKWIHGFYGERPEFVALIPMPPEGHPKRFYDWDEWMAMPRPRKVGISLERISSDDAPFSPVSFRIKVTPHGSRASHLTDLLKYESAELVARSTGQTAGSVSYYNRGEHSLIQRMAGAYNHKDQAKSAIINNLKVTEDGFAKDLLASIKSGLLPDFIIKYGLTRLYVGQGDKKGLAGSHVIAADLPATVLTCSTHLCPYGFNCPEQIGTLLGGYARCSICPEAIFATHFIYAVSAKRHQLAEELADLQLKIRNVRAVNKIDKVDAELLQCNLNRLAEDLMGWYLIERSLDVMLVKGSEDNSAPSYLTGNSANVASEVNTNVSIIASDSVSKFLLRVEQVYDFPQFLSPGFADKMNRCVRLILAEKGDLYEAIMLPSDPQPQIHLMASIRQLMEVDVIDLKRLIKLVNMTPEEWSSYLVSGRPTLPEVKVLDELLKK